MQQIGLASIVGDAELRKVVTSQQAVYDEDLADAPTPAKTRLPVPDHLKGKVVPADINAFMNDLHPNMVAYVGGLLRTKDESTINDVINDFAVYMLDTAPSLGIPRFQIFDPTKHAKLPYFKWFLQNLNFFCRGAKRDAAKESRNYTLSETSYEETAEKPGNHAINLDTMLVTEVDPVGDHFVVEIDEFLNKYSVSYEGRHCFEAHAHYLFRAKMTDEDNNTIATTLGISHSAVAQWLVKLRRLLVTQFPDSFELHA